MALERGATTIQRRRRILGTLTPITYDEFLTPSGHHQLGIDTDPTSRLEAAFDELNPTLRN